MANSQRKSENLNALKLFLKEVTILPIYNALDYYAEEKAHLKSQGTMIDEFDLLIGASAVANKMTLITNNTKHFERLTDIQLEDWAK